MHAIARRLNGRGEEGGGGIVDFLREEGKRSGSTSYMIMWEKVTGKATLATKLSNLLWKQLTWQNCV